MSTIDDYIGLITSEHADKPKFIAALTAITQGMVEAQTLLASIPALYDVDTAVGAQLDVVGQWVGISRKVLTPITGVYFSFDTADVGFDEGVWFGPFDAVEGVTSMDDETYRLIIGTKIAANQWDGSLAQAQTILASIFQTSPGTLMFVIDNFDMTMTLALSGVIPSSLFIALLTQGYMSLRPAAVDIKEIVVTSISGTAIFGFDSDTDYIAGFDTGTWGVSL